MKKLYALNKISKKSVAVTETNPYETVVVKTFKNQKDAVNLCDLLNKGRGFAGWTPKFIIDKIKESV